jgi:hypothetical protein
MWKNKVVLFMIPILTGLGAGFIFLNPVSSMIIHVFEENVYNLPHIIGEAFSGQHGGMEVFFSLIGGFVGFLFSLNSLRLRRTNSYLAALNNELEHQCTDLVENSGMDSREVARILEEITPYLSKVQNSLELMSGGATGTINLRQSELLKITKDNIASLFRIMEYFARNADKASLKNSYAGHDSLNDISG